MSGRGARSARWVGAALVAVLAGCGVPVEDQADTVEEVPFGLLERGSPSTASTEPPPDGSATTAQIYLVDPSGEQLVAVTREVADPDPATVVDALLLGPTGEQADAGLSSALPDGEAVGSVSVSGGVATVALDEQLAALPAPAHRLAVAQLVYTLTGRPGVGSVVFTLGGSPVPVPGGDGTIIERSVSRDDFRQLGG